MHKKQPSNKILSSQKKNKDKTERKITKENKEQRGKGEGGKKRLKRENASPRGEPGDADLAVLALHPLQPPIEELHLTNTAKEHVKPTKPPKRTRSITRTEWEGKQGGARVRRSERRRSRRGRP